MKLRAFILMVFGVSFLLEGCSGFGIVSSSDPERKLSDATVLYSKYNRPMPAERLIREAIAIYEKENDQSGLGNAYNQYGWFFRSHSVIYHSEAYKRDGFLDSAATYESRYEIALKYFRKAEALHKSSHTYDVLSNTYLGIGFIYSYSLGDQKAACKAYDHSLEANRKNIAENPNAVVQVSGGHSSYAELIASYKKEADCS